MLPESELLLVVAGFIIAFILAFGIGANDVANSFGTSVGSRVLSLRAAYVLATICEVSGAILLGGQVSSTIRKGIIDPNLFNATENGAIKLMYGQVASLGGSCIWLLVATFFHLPVSATHSIVGATAGFGLVLFGLKGIQWIEIAKIVGSWFASPILSGILSLLMFLAIKYAVLKKEHPMEPALYSLPLIFGATIVVNVFSVLYGGLPMFNLPDIPIWMNLVASFGSGILAAFIVFFCARPLIRKRVIKRIKKENQREADGIPEYAGFGKEPSNIFRNLKAKLFGVFKKQKNAASPSKSETYSDSAPEYVTDDAFVTELPSFEAGDSILKVNATNLPNPLKEFIAQVDDRITKETQDDAVSDDLSHHFSLVEPALIADRPEEGHVFSFAQIMTATFGSFVHGGNDVSNAIGPLVGLWLVAISGDVLTAKAAPIWILVYGGMGISVGLWIWGKKVMQTIGKDLTPITPSSGMCIELGAAVTVLVASKLGIPISTTHCQVGSVVFVGWFRAKESVNWKLFINIFVAWVVTLPISGGLSALLMYIFLNTIPM